MVTSSVNLRPLFGKMPVNASAAGRRFGHFSRRRSVAGEKLAAA